MIHISQDPGSLKLVAYINYINFWYQLRCCFHYPKTELPLEYKNNKNTMPVACHMYVTVCNIQYVTQSMYAMYSYFFKTFFVFYFFNFMITGK